jgi:phosphotransferase system HPr (HPr) family protein
MIEHKATVQNSAGIHCRPSAVIVKEARRYSECDIRVSAISGMCNPGSVLALISMGLEQGAVVNIQVSGPDEEAVCARMVELFERNYDFPPREENRVPIE